MVDQDLYDRHMQSWYANFSLQGINGSATTTIFVEIIDEDDQNPTFNITDGIDYRLDIAEGVMLLIDLCEELRLKTKDVMLMEICRSIYNCQ